VLVELITPGVESLAITLACGAVTDADAFSSHEGHHRRARSASSPGAVDRAANLVAEAAASQDAFWPMHSPIRHRFVSAAVRAAEAHRGLELLEA
jgi:hypothetical protein